MRKYIITIETIRNNDEGDVVYELDKTGLFSAESRWDALKKAKKIAYKESLVYGEKETGREREYNGLATGFSITKSDAGYYPHEYIGVRVKIHALETAKDGIEWEE